MPWPRYSPAYFFYFWWRKLLIFFVGGRNDEKSAAAANGSSVSSRPPPSSIGTSHTADHVTNVTSSVANDDVIKGGETDDWDGEDDFAETTNILSSRQHQQPQQQQQQQTYLDYPAGMVCFMSLIKFNGLNKKFGKFGFFQEN